jgi:hypothetical protein
MSTCRQGGGGRDGDAEHRVRGPQKKNCDLAQTGAIFRQESSGSMSVAIRQFDCNSECVVVVQVNFFNGICPFPFLSHLQIIKIL